MQWEYEADKPKALVETPYVAKWLSAKKGTYSSKRKDQTFSRGSTTHYVRSFLKDFDTTTPVGIDIELYHITEFILKLKHTIHSFSSLLKLKRAHPSERV